MTLPGVRPVLPVAKKMRELFEALLGREVDVRDAAAWAPLPRDNAIVAEYVDDHETLIVLPLLDLPLAGYLGAALGLLPARGAKEMVAEGRLAPIVVDNVYESLNIAASLFSTPHVRITAMHGPGGALPLAVQSSLSRIGGRVDLTMTIGGYGTGRFGFILAG